MAGKRSVNRMLIGIAIIAVLCLLLVMCSGGREEYQSVKQLPAYSKDSKPQDGDTQTDTIKALQAFAKEAVDKATILNNKTENNLKQVIENKNRVSSLEIENKMHSESAESNRKDINNLITQLSTLQTELQRMKDDNGKKSPSLDEHGIPVGFGFDDLPADPGKGSWNNPVDREMVEGAERERGFSNLFSRQPKDKNNGEEAPAQKKKEEAIVQVYTVAKDSTLMDAVAMTAMVGRIPVNGTTPDPYPLKILIGKENLAANGLELPEIEGMIFSGLAFGDWNLSCVRAQLYSASFIFTDGTIVNHSESANPLAHITDPYGNCVAGRFVTNAPKFLAQQSLLGGLSAAGAAYAEAQTESQTSALTGTTTTTVVGSISDKVLGEVVEDTTDEIRQWFLDRQKQSFDAVVVGPGARVAVHIDKELAIDHKEYGRRVWYASGDQNRFRGLD